jgi:dynein heavy chain
MLNDLCRYTAVESTWRKIMQSVIQNPKVLAVCAQEKLLKQLMDCNKLLDIILKGLNEYLEIKRAAFPRFYFLSNEELLDILSRSKGTTNNKVSVFITVSIFRC